MKGWEQKTLGDVAYLSGRIGWKGLTAKEYTSIGPLFLSVHSLNYGDYVDFRDAFHISQERYDESPEIMLQRADILICKDGAGIGKLGIIEDLPAPATINSSLLLIRATNRTDPKFLYHALCSPSFQRIVQERIDGATTPHLYQKEIRQFPIFVPPLSEQRRIVAILDEAFAGLEVLRANAEKNLKNARELFETYLNAIFTRKGEGWVETTLGKIAEFKNGLNFTKSSKGEIIKIVGVKDFQNDFWVPLDGLESARIEGRLRPDYLLQASDILTVRSNGNKQLIGRCILAGVVQHRTSHSGFTIRIRVTAKGVEPKFLARYLKSRTVRRMLVESGDGANISSLNQQALAALPVAFPSVEQQYEIIDRLDFIEEESSRLESLARRKLAAVAELKRSILQKAFVGELTSDTASPRVVVTKKDAQIETASPEFAAQVLAFAYHLHALQKKEKTFGRVKGQKILHLTESIGGIELGRKPIKDAAGPNDFQHMLKAEE